MQWVAPSKKDTDNKAIEEQLWGADHLRFTLRTHA